jgi:hypothetical protein
MSSGSWWRPWRTTSTPSWPPSTPTPGNTVLHCPSHSDIP